MRERCKKRNEKKSDTKTNREHCMLYTYKLADSDDNRRRHEKKKGRKSEQCMQMTSSNLGIGNSRARLYREKLQRGLIVRRPQTELVCKSDDESGSKYILQ